MTTDHARFFSPPDHTSHKYSRGVLGLRTGSSAYPGAAVLGAEAAWRTGIGSVRFFSALDESPSQCGLPSPAAAVLAVRPETVFADDTAANRARVDAWVIGSGTDPQLRSFAETEALRQLLHGDTPVVVDAGALDLLVAGEVAAPCVVTPHLGEFTSLYVSCGFAATEIAAAEIAADPAAAAARVANHLGVTVVLKGSRSIVASPQTEPHVYGPATPRLATAGTGDVLAGVLGALLASNAALIAKDAASLSQLAIAAVALHDRAARLAADDPDAIGAGHPITALDVAAHLAEAR